MIQFAFFLDAWRYCRDHKISIKNIVRLDWDVWGVPKKKKVSNVHKQRQATATKPKT